MEFQVRIGIQDVQRSVRGARILDDVFKGGSFLILDAFNALPHVPGVVIAGRDDAEIRFGIHGEG